MQDDKIHRTIQPPWNALNESDQIRLPPVCTNGADVLLLNEGLDISFLQNLHYVLEHSIVCSQARPHQPLFQKWFKERLEVATLALKRPSVEPLSHSYLFSSGASLSTCISFPFVSPFLFFLVFCLSHPVLLSAAATFLYDPPLSVSTFSHSLIGLTKSNPRVFLFSL